MATICADAGQIKAKKKNVATCKAHAIFENVMPIPQNQIRKLGRIAQI
jgi:hypothetical protein